MQKFLFTYLMTLTLLASQAFTATVDRVSSQKLLNSVINKDPIGVYETLLIEKPDPNKGSIHEGSLLLVSDMLGHTQCSDTLRYFGGKSLFEKKVYELAFEPKTSTRIPLENQFSLNLLWINLNPQDLTKNNALHILGNGSDRNPSFFLKLKKWVLLNPNTSINLWYDGALVTEKAKRETEKFLQTLGSHVHLANLRNVPLMKSSKELQLAFHPGVSVYFRVDLAKAILSDFLMKRYQPGSSGERYVVFSDIDMIPMTKEALFDSRSLSFLLDERVGFVFALATQQCNDFENGFWIFNASNKKFIDNHYESIILGAAELVKKATCTSLKQLTSEENRKNKEIIPLEGQSVYSLYHSIRSFKNQENQYPRKIVLLPPSSFDDDDHEPKDPRFESSLFFQEKPYGFDGRLRPDDDDDDGEIYGDYLTTGLYEPILHDWALAPQ